MATSGTPRRRSREDVAEMALQLLDEYGLPDLTMRNLATALGVQPSALYWHFPNKQALLAAVSARILAPLAELPIEDLGVLGVHEAVRVLGARLRDCLLTYRDASELVSSSLSLGLVGSPVRPQLLEVARRHGVPDALSEVAAEVLVHFTVGYVFHEQQRRTADSLGLLDAPDSLNPDDAVAATSDGDSFAKALTMIADGLDVSVTRNAEPRA
ncbi:TetR family transcriptional regulator [Brachybacterium alimentarium]|uniref:TetR family transcriptional regulator n=1 Tax=Brachybacterium alimentarium TaxID=47845 RepID=UPI003FD21059